MTYYAVLQVFAKSNQLPRAEAVFSEMRSKGMAKVANGYNMRMNGYGRVRDFEAMEGVFGEMQAASVAPDEVRGGDKDVCRPRAWSWRLGLRETSQREEPEGGYHLAWVARESC